ncbi:MAG: hypothetical protein ABIQ02_02330, partial [Saprospiraceae bacterium]
MFCKVNSTAIHVALFILLCSILSCKNDPGTPTSTEKINTSPAQVSASIKLISLPASETGINFVNKINDEGMINIFTWHFLYNGGGVA